MINNVCKLCVRGQRKSILLLFLSIVFSVHAEEAIESGTSFELTNIYINDNNVKRLGIAQSDEYYLLSPTLSLNKHMGKHMAVFVYEGAYTKFNDLTSLNYNNHKLNGKLVFDHSLRFSTDFDLYYDKGVEIITGASSLADDFTEFTSLEMSRAVATTLYGTEESRGQLIVSLESSANVFSGNQQEFRSVDSLGGTSQFFYRTAPNTRVVTELSLINFNYTNKAIESDQSNLQHTILLGMEWRLSEQLYSLLKLGYQTKTFRSTALNNVSTLSYHADVSWSPLAQTQIDINASRNVMESTIQDVSAFVSTTTGFKLKHGLSDTFDLSLAYSKSKSTFSSGRDDSTNILIGLDIRFNQFSKIAFEYNIQDKDSILSKFSYKANILNIAYTLTLD